MEPTYEPKAKRRKVNEAGAKAVVEIKSTQDLHNLLHFKQSSSPEVKNGIQQFKSFLTDIPKIENESSRAEKFRILKDYCNEQSSDEKHALCFPDLISTWSFAAQSNSDAISSAVPAVLALFLKTISTQLQFREFGISLGRTLLQKEQLRLFDRGLTATKTKEFLISPCLRLLTEIVNFDGGALANSIYSRRDTVFKRLDILLDHVGAGDYDEDRRKPTLRRIAQRYVLANLKFQSTGVKGDIISEGKILRKLLQGISRDGPDIASDILHVIQRHVLGDPVLSRKSKTRFFNAANLSSLAALYNAEQRDHDFAPEDANGTVDDDRNQNEAVGSIAPTVRQQRKSVRSLVHDLLLSVCTIHENGVLLPQTGWYPFGTDPEVSVEEDHDDGAIDLGLDSPLYFDNYDQKVPVKNGTLSLFIQSLRPAADNLQATLMLKIFEVAPELVADYFSKKNKFVTEPKAEATWLGEAAFLFTVIELPTPPHCGWDSSLPAIPPPASIVIESILPRPLDRSTTTRCLNLNHDVITLFAARVMTVAFEKLSKILALFRTATHGAELWRQASDKLENLLSQRCPPIKVLIQALQRTSKEDIQLRGALIELLATYFRILPRVALRDKYDVSAAMADVIQEMELTESSSSAKVELLEQLSNLTSIAQISSTTNWWNKSGSEASPFCVMLKIVTSASTTPESLKIRALLKTILVEYGVVSTGSLLFDALVASLSPSKKWTPEPSTFAFIENCTARIARQPVHYMDLATLNLETATEAKSSALLLACLAEQWSFVAKSNDDDAQKNIAEWTARFLSTIEGEGQQEQYLTMARKNILEGLDSDARLILEKAFKKQAKRPVKLEASEDTTELPNNGIVEPHEADVEMTEVLLDDLFGLPARCPESLEGLERWDAIDLESAVSNGRLGRLIQCLASEEEETRRYAFSIMRGLMVKVKESTYAEKGPLYLLLGELCETVQGVGLGTVIPSAVAQLAVQITVIITEPSHKFYGKVNKFLNKGPTWHISRILSYWIDRILLKEPEDDEGHGLEVTWLMQLLVDGLRTPSDMEVYRKANVFERILSLYNSSQLHPKASLSILQVVYRAIQVGGSMTLITRVGILSWIDMQLTAQGSDAGILKALNLAIETSTDAEEVEDWKTKSSQK